MIVDSLLKGFKDYLILERSLSHNSVEAYIRDVNQLITYLQANELKLESITLKELQGFVAYIAEAELSVNTQARILSGVKMFFKYLIIEEVINNNPTELLEAPKTLRSIPPILSVQEIDTLFNHIDLSTPEGQRNRAILETLYSCGLRVSELLSLKISDLYLDIDFIRVIGKRNKERLIPIGSMARKYIKLYIDYVRCHLKIAEKYQDILFLNKRGTPLSRVMIFMIIKQITEQSGIHKNVHPHTFRHSFATHLVEAGADLRAVQEMLGHSSITTTEIYTHLDRGYLRKTLIDFHPHYKNIESKV